MCLCSIDTHRRIGDMVILRLRASLCCIVGSILSYIFGFYSDLSPPVPLVPVLTGPPNYGNTGLFVAQFVFSSTTTVGFQLPPPPLRGHRTISLSSPRLVCPRLCSFHCELITVDTLVFFVLFLFSLCLSNEYIARSPVSWRTIPLRCSHRR